MLSDRERATLHEIEGRFLAEDPGFVRTFDARAQRLPSASRTPIAEYTILTWITSILSVLLLLAGGWAGALLLALVAVALSLARRRGGAPTPRT